MRRDCILSSLEEVRPGPGPEWGGGGIYSMKYHRGALYYTQAFEARARLVRGDCSSSEYDFSLVGPPPRSGGDTYNAVDAVDGKIYFGGWVHSPAILERGPGRRAEVRFENKYSHVHEMDVSDGSVKLLWKEGARHPKLWACEVTDVLYNPMRDSLIAARGDGHINCGVLEVERSGRGASMVSDDRVLRGEIFMDMACLSKHTGWGGDPGLVCLDLETYDKVYSSGVPTPERAADSGGLAHYRDGDVFQLHTKVYVSHKGGISVFDPEGGEEPIYYRILDFGDNPYGPMRSNALYLGGGALVAFNTPTASTVRTTDELPTNLQISSRRSPAPTILVYVSPSEARVAGLTGGRVTSMESVGGEVLIAWATQPNLERYDATALDTSVRGVSVAPHSHLLSSRPPPIEVEVDQRWVGENVFGGLPLHGYREAYVRGEGARLELRFYRLGWGPGEYEEERLELGKGYEDLSHLTGGIVSARLESSPKSGRLLFRAL